MLVTALSFKLLFVLLEFLESVAAIYQDLLAGKNPNTVIVPTSSSGQHRQRQPPNDCNPLEGVEASLFYQCLESLCDRSKYRYEWSLKYKFEVSLETLCKVGAVKKERTLNKLIFPHGSH